MTDAQKKKKKQQDNKAKANPKLAEAKKTKPVEKAMKYRVSKRLWPQKPKYFGNPMLNNVDF